MGKTRISGLLGRNIFKEAFEQFDEEEFFSKLHHKVKNKPYYERYVGFKNTINILSYIFSVASTLTSAYAVYWLASWAGAAPWLSLAIGGIILIFLEQIKRKASEETWQMYFFEGRLPAGWLFLSLLLFAVGVFTSSFGAKEGAIDFAPPAALVETDTAAVHYRDRIAALEQENDSLARQKNARGEIFWPAQKQMERNKEIIASYEARALTRDEKHESHNEDLQAAHDEKVAFASRVFMLTQIFMELCFEGCIAYVWYFYFRSYVERRRLKGIPEESPDTAPYDQAAPVPNPSPAPSYNGQASPPGGRNGYDANSRAPIGFFTEAQKTGLTHQGLPDDSQEVSASVPPCTDLYREDNILIHDDLYTVLHEYRRGGKNYFTPYTENQILSRIGQYERDIAQAVQKEMGEEIITNRRRWLEYWQAKLAELHQKQRDAGMR